MTAGNLMNIPPQKNYIVLRWITAPDFGDDLKCDGNEVAVGSCSGGGSFSHKDCPGEKWYS